MITGAFLAEAASVTDNKLNVSGGVLYRFVVGPDRLAQFTLVVLTQVETGNSDRQVTVEMLDPDGDQARHDTFELPDAAADGEIGFAFYSIEETLPMDGRWVIVVVGGAGAISLPLMVSGS